MSTISVPAAAPSRVAAELDPSAAITYRIEIAATGRLLKQGFECGPDFAAPDDRDARFAEFGSQALALSVLLALRYTALLAVVPVRWERTMDGQELASLCHRIATTGGSANMLFWSPLFPALRAHLGLPRIEIPPTARPARVPDVLEAMLQSERLRALRLYSAASTCTGKL